MSYQVLARKYRPSNFQELEGQEHVLRALVNALDNNRLHHAYLFTGTRGVGKTTIARILAKCLNCEEGISSTPCGKCGSCLEIAEGRSIDLIEYDAASRTKVEDTREILDNVQYMPTRCRFKVYLIDEVHMLSNHSFNALLKTLEEPPEHVKFLLATTDPKKLPVTVLSRCLQFNLKNISPERVVNYLQKILPAEGVEFDDAALWQLGRAADGSMRDALSLTDQAISFGNNSVNDADVKMMLGSIDQREVYELLDFLINKDAASLLAKVKALAEFAPDYSALLAELLSVLHRVAVAQAVPDAIDNSQGDQALVSKVAEAMSREDVQLFYQIGLIGQRDLPHSPDLRAGFEMVLLRMLAFTPLDSPSDDSGSDEAKKKTVIDAPPASPVSSKPAETTAKSDSPATGLLASLVSQSLQSGPNKAPTTSANDAGSAIPVDIGTPRGATVANAAVVRERTQPERLTRPSESVNVSLQGVETPEIEAETPVIDWVDPTLSSQDVTFDELKPEHWADLLPKLGLSGVTLYLASNCALKATTDMSCELILSEHHSAMWNNTHENRIATALAGVFDIKIKVIATIGQAPTLTPAEIDALKKQVAQAEAVKIILNDEKVKQLIAAFDGRLDKDSIKAK